MTHRLPADGIGAVPVGEVARGGGFAQVRWEPLCPNWAGRLSCRRDCRVRRGRDECGGRWCGGCIDVSGAGGGGSLVPRSGLQC